MNQDQQGSRPGGTGGSVQRARQMLEAGYRAEAPPSSVNVPPRNPQRPTQAKRGNGKGVVGAISRPTPTPQWPLRDDMSTTVSKTMGPAKGPAPDRPKRPSDVPSILDSSKVQDITPLVNYRPEKSQGPTDAESPSTRAQDPSPDYGYQSSSTLDVTGSPKDQPLNLDTSSTASTLPVPKRNPNNGPPPSAWRGRSSTYSRGAFVSPIPEESNEGTPARQISVASNSMMQSTRGSEFADSDILGAYHDAYLSASDEEEQRSEEFAPEDDKSLVRQASLGKRGKPSLRTIGTKSSSEREVSPPREKSRSPPKEPAEAIATVAEGSYLDTEQSNSSNESHVGKKTLNLFHSRDSSGSESFDLAKAPIILDESSVSPTASGAGFLQSQRNYASRSPGFSEKVPENLRPPQLNMAAVKEAEARGSLTSLPDLIRRATQLASNLDRGKTASRLGLWEFMNAAAESKSLSPRQYGEKRGSGSLSDMLASFPPPRNNTPDQKKGSWPFVPAEKTPGDRRDWKPLQTPTPEPEKRGRRCCGMRLWVFILLCTIILLLVAAAVIIPVMLIVVPRNKSNSATAAANPCVTSLPCSNGGVSVLSNNVCACVCVNGFSGSQCNQSGDSSCTSQTIVDGSSNSHNATMGNALPAVFTESSSLFNIPLNQTEIIGLFSAYKVACSDQNALVSFGGSTGTSAENVRADAVYEHVTLPLVTELPDAKVVERQNAATLATSNGILFQPTPTTSVHPSHTISIASYSSHPATATPTPAPTKVLEFARVAILYIFGQTTSLTEASDAQTDIALFLNENWSNDTTKSTRPNMNMNMTSMTMPINFVLNFVNFTITLSNGTIVGGTETSGHS